MMGHLIRQMGHIAIATPDPEGSAADLVDLVGLKITQQTPDTIVLSSNERLHEISFTRSSDPGVLAIGLEAVDDAAVDEVLQRLKSEGLDIISDQPLAVGAQRGVRFCMPNGPILEVHTPVPRTQRQRHIGPGSRPRRIEHANIKVADTHVARDIVTKVLGMRLSDRTANDELNWFRAADGYHHTIALSPGQNTLHHYAFDFHALEDLAGIADGLVLKDRSLLWGPGRHGAGGNVFQYYVDRDGCVVEMSVGMDRIDNDATYQARTWAITEGLADRWINVWGSPPPADFFDPELPFLRSPTPSSIAA